MPRFYLHCYNGSGFTEDCDGTELPDRSAALAKAFAAAREIMAEDVRKGLLDLTSYIEIQDDQHRPVLTLTFLETVTISHRYGVSGQTGNDMPAEPFQAEDPRFRA